MSLRFPSAPRSALAGLWVLLSVMLAACGGGGGGSSATAAPTAAPAATSPASPTSPADEPTTSQSAQSPVDVDEVELSTYALWADELGTTPVTVNVRAAGTEPPTVSYFDGLVGGSGAYLTEILFDDGTHGDEVANDGIWTLRLTLGLAEPASLRLYDGLLDMLTLSIRKAGDERNLELAVVSRALEGTATAEALSASISATDSMVNVVDPSFDGQTLSTITEQLYTAFADDPFDFVVIFHSRPTGDGVPRSLGVRNAIEGINLGAYDSSAAYGSTGRLQQVVFQNANVLGREVNHEVGHRWGAFLDDAALNLSIPTGFHWGVSDHIGQMGNGPYLQDDGRGGFLVTNANGSEQFISNPFSRLELYLMGLAGPDEVAPLRFVTDPTVATPFGATLPAADTQAVTIEDIVGVYGERVPAPGASPNHFSAAFVVVSDVPLSDAELALSSHVSRYVAGSSPGGVRVGGQFELLDPPSFAAATGFRGSIETRLPAR